MGSKGLSMSGHLYSHCLIKELGGKSLTSSFTGVPKPALTIQQDINLKTLDFNSKYLVADFKNQ